MSELYSKFLECGIITTDSRDCPAGSIFFALKGESFNGNQYAAAALDKGCAYAVIDEAQYALDERYIVVPDVLTTLQQLANEHRRALGTPIIGITGTNGKTTTKELIATVLSQKYNVLYTQGNFNNHIGVPKTLLRLTPEHDIAVIEMGANHPGEIKTLVNIVEPNYGIITNVGKAHIEGFGSFEGVIKTKGELYDFLRQKADSKVFIDTDNEHLMGISQGLTLVPYVKGEVIACDPFLRFSWSPAEVQDALRASSKVQDASLVQEGGCRSTAGAYRSGEATYRSEAYRSEAYRSEPSSRIVNVNVPVPVYEVTTHLIGAYNMKNMLAAATIGLAFGITPEQINEALAGYVPTNNRSQLTVTQHNRLIVDTYNANPTSMMAALQNFVLMAVEPKMAILGDMGELGSISRDEHQKIVDYLLQHHLDNVWLVGKEFGNIDSPFRKFADVASVKEALAAHRPEGQYILIKGSNSNRLFELPELL
jgi:UDP-N-acetylmuramoyl-tripeptide--D-alanyl-D-alanine ligase